MEKLTDILKKFYSSMESGDPHYIKDIFSQRDDAIAIGSDPKEWWYGYESVVEAFRKQSEAFPESSIKKSDPKISIEGPVGWFSDDITFQFDEGSADMRISGVFRQEAGKWKLAQMHASIGVPNVETDFGDVDLSQ